MGNRIKLLHLLADGKFHSGEVLGSELSVSRAAVWKLIHSLKKYDLDICSIKGKGYRLSVEIEFLNQDKLLAMIQPDMLKHITLLEAFEELTSTNQYLLDRSVKENICGVVVLSEYQSAGRGRRGSKWYSPFGAGINLSIGWRFDYPVESLTQLSMMAGVAVIRTLSACGIHGIGLKWPNDIFFQGMKLGGILIEMRGESAGPCDVVIGIGINFAFPENLVTGIDRAWIDVASIKSPPPSRNALTARLISELVKLLEEYKQQAVQEILDEWRQYDCVNGNVVTLLLPNQSVTGRVMGINDHGALLLSVDNEIKQYTAGEISMRLHS
jgi:BirA family biotin operon repressor/biotin-[acetyl-CoA-carboxylase] ligase